MISSNIKLAVIGLGYVGLPIAVAFGKKRDVIGFDINCKRIEELRAGFDRTNETDKKDLLSSRFLSFSTDVNDLSEANCYIVTVPTPINENKSPDLSLLIGACELIGSNLKRNDIVIFESTVYPGATEEVCVPVLENFSNLKFNQDFFCGYSPERINPGDKKHRLENIVKVTAGSNLRTAKFVDNLYKEIINAGTFLAESIKIAEAAKVIENTQRDINIALINEIAILLNKLDIDTEKVLQAAETKWNFLSFRPGLVGGHCIGVDPYYLTHKAKEIGYEPNVILSGRNVNDGMGFYVVEKLLEKMRELNIDASSSNILIMGLTFKENCNDLRNTRVVDIYECLTDRNISVDVYDPVADKEEAYQEYKIKLVDMPSKDLYDVILICVAHDQFKEMQISEIRSFGKEETIIYDLKNVIPINQSHMRL